ncbi:MAG: PD-(D/E)XK nuclease family protein [Bacteroidales bacterium]|nr:PD-(D/E)XK nuclease family protein [Bacteroidales bacterium]
MTPFLKKVADHIFDNHKEQLQELSVVVPNRRAALFLGKYLSQKTDVPIWSPKFYSIEDFVFEHSGFQLMPMVDLIFELYEVHLKIEGSKHQSFDRFNGWGQLLLKDFNEIDLYMKDADSLFQYLSAAKTISKWSLDPDDLTNLERDYLKFYASLGDYYKELVARLESKNMAYQGMAYRKLAEQIGHADLDGKPMIFAGFNALTPAEEIIFDFYKERAQATILWDIDEYYFDNPKQEAGAFLRKQLAKTNRSEISWITKELKEGRKKINISGVSGDVNIAKMAGNILNQLAEDSTLSGAEVGDNTAVVMANESLIVPLLYSLPDTISTYNVTMSYPSKLSRVYELVNNIFDLFLRHVSEDGQAEKNPAFYHKQLEVVLLHPLIVQHFHVLKSDNLGSVIIKTIRENNISFISQQKFPSQFDLDEAGEAYGFLKLFAQKIGSPQDILSFIDNILQELFDQLGDSNEAKMDREFLFHYLTLLRRLQDLLSDHPYIKHLTTLKNLFISLASAQGIPFVGEPLMGVQIMGMLETRALDFENLILLSVNEGMLPKSHVYQSFILPDIKRELGLPLPVDNDSVFAYHFYRLLQGASNIHILYNTQNDSMGQGELSRYVQQIEWELKEVNPKVEISHKLYHTPLLSENFDRKIQFPKDDYALNRLKRIAEGSGFSPSTLNNYLACSLKFYFQRILGMYTEEEVEETLAANTQGTVIHGVLEDFYLRKKGRLLSESFLNDITKEYKAELEKRFRKEFKKGDIDHGQNLLFRKVAERFVEHFISNERKMLKDGIPCTILDLELDLKRSINIEHQGVDMQINFRGNADRIDRLGDTVRVIDYKTGKVDDSDVKLFKGKQSMWDSMFLGKKPKAFQLMMYAWMYKPQVEDQHHLQAGISGLKYHSKYFPLAIDAKDDTHITGSHLSNFETDLTGLMIRLFDKEEAFVQCEDDVACKYCDYKFICGR